MSSINFYDRLTISINFGLASSFFSLLACILASGFYMRQACGVITGINWEKYRYQYKNRNFMADVEVNAKEGPPIDVCFF